MNTKHTFRAKPAKQPNPHTLEQWQIEVYHEDKGWAEIHTVRRSEEIPTQGYLIAIVFDTPDCPIARLIAQAPDMFHWLKEMEHYLSSRQSMGHELTAGELWLLEHIRSTIKEVT
jgi:hypothetical protein